MLRNNYLSNIAADLRAHVCVRVCVRFVSYLRACDWHSRLHLVCVWFASGFRFLTEHCILPDAELGQRSVIRYFIAKVSVIYVTRVSELI